MIKEIVWDEHNILHIAAHRVVPQEVEEVCFAKNIIFKSRQNRYCVFGRIDAGRYLFIVVIFLGKGRGKVITARDMDKMEKRLFRKKGG